MDSMDKSSDKKFPVSLEFFKKHVQYEELVDAILKDASRGDDEKLKETLTCERKRENCIKNYYTYFYTKPRIRERWAFKLKPMPKGIKAKILEIPEYAKKHKNKEKNHADHRNQNIEDLQFPKQSSSIGAAVATPLQYEHFKLPSNEICKDDLNKNIICQPNCDQDIQGEKWQQQNGSEVASQRVSPEKIYSDNSSENINSAKNKMEIDNRMDTDSYLASNVKPLNNARKEAVHILENVILVPANRLTQEQSNLEITKDKQNKITSPMIYFSGIFNDEFLLHYISRKCQDTTKQQHILKLIKEKFPLLTDSNMIHLSKSMEISKGCFAESKGSSAIDEAKILLFCNVHKTHTLSYILRTRHGLKYEIVQILLSVTLEEFQSLVHIYEADELKCDSLLMKRLYQYVTANMKVWPTNLFIKLEDLFNFLKHKSINFQTINQNVLLEHISPKFFHWSDLQNKTNFLDCVRANYLRRYAVELDVTNAVAMEAEIKDYYNRCWKYDEWIHQIPVIKRELVEHLRLSKETTQSDIDDAPSKYTGLAQYFSDFLMAPSSQQQINMSPHELVISEGLADETSFQSQQDPFNNSIERSAQASPFTLGVVIPATETNIKSEPFQMLKNLQFYIDGDDDDVMHCTVMNSEPILLDDTEIDLNCSADDLENKQHSRVLSLTPVMTSETPPLRQNLPYLSDIIECDEITNTPSFILPDDPPSGSSRGNTNDIQVIESESDNNLEYSYTQNATEDEAITSQIKQDQQPKITDFVNTITRQVQHKIFVSNMHGSSQLRRISERQPDVEGNCVKEKLIVVQAEGHQLADVPRVLRTQGAQTALPSSKVHNARKIIAHKDPTNPTIFVPQLRHKFPSLVTVRCATNLRAPQDCIAISKNTTSCDRGNAIFPSKTKQPPNQIAVGNNNCTKSDEGLVVGSNNTTSCDSVNAIFKSSLNQQPNQVIVGNNNYTKSGMTNSSVSFSSRLTPIQLVSKTMLHRTLCQIDYFQSISSQNIAQYQLPTIVVDSTYLQALIICDGIRIRLCNKSLSALFPQWTSSLKQDLFIVLRDLTEYHYSLFDLSKEKSATDIRIRVLHYLFRTAPSFSLGNLSYELGNPEFGYCYSITNNNNRSYKRKPHADLTQALKPSMVAKILELKRKL